jgi:hypothetical protein
MKEIIEKIEGDFKVTYYLLNKTIVHKEIEYLKASRLEFFKKYGTI